MKATRLAIPDVILFEPEVFGDDRGFFFESFNQRKFEEFIKNSTPVLQIPNNKENTFNLKIAGMNSGYFSQNTHFVQDNHSRSAKNVIRGLHYQLKNPQGKLVRVVSGTVFDVAVDIRRQSPTFGQWIGELLTEANKKQLWIPEGFAHGFAVLSDVADMVYKTTDFWAPEHERCIAWDDPKLNIQWLIEGHAQLSGKDKKGLAFKDAEIFES